MRVLVNGKALEVAVETTVAEVVDGLGSGRAGLAVAVNEEVVPRSRWEITPLVDDDRVEVLHAAQGG